MKQASCGLCDVHGSAMRRLPLENWSVGPESSLYFPATQATQVPFAPGHPALHVQFAMESLSAAECKFAGHVWHCERSSAGYQPASQGAQRSAIASTVPENLPAAHRVHAPGPGSTLYLPVTQTTHSPSVLDQPAKQKQSTPP